MKILFHILIMILLAVLVMLFIYPALHEAAHALTAIFCDAEVVDVQVFPTAHTDIIAEHYNRIEMILMTMSGGVVPLLVLFCLPQGTYYIYYIKLVVALISASGAVISLIYVFLHLKGIDNMYDDAVRLLIYYPDTELIVLIILVVQISVSLLYCFLTKPLTRMTVILKKSAVE